MKVYVVEADYELVGNETISEVSGVYANEKLAIEAASKLVNDRRTNGLVFARVMTYVVDAQHNPVSVPWYWDVENEDSD